MADQFVWLPELGRGFYPVDEKRQPYDAAYFAKYCAYAETELGRRLTQARVELVARHLPPSVGVIDVGIGSGAFVAARPGTQGYDINPVAIEWLHERGLWRNPYWGAAAISCWDSLEHIRDPEALLKPVASWLFVSLPIFTGPDHALRSKHFRKDEHYWYWSRAGFVGWLAEQGFEVVEQSRIESELGREDIESFAAVRVRDPS